jgi:hypothetical protein
MHSVFVTYAPETAENTALAAQVRAAFDASSYTVSVKPAAGASMQDLVGADIIVFGLQKMQGADTPPEYAELLRSLKGVNLAGRAAGTFCLGGEKSSARLRKALRDTDAAVAEDDPVFGDQKPARQADVDAWVRKLSGLFQDLRRARA